MDSKTIRQKYLEFFKARGHKEIAPAKLVPENDPSTLFTTAGMQQLVSFLKGEKRYPTGSRLVNSQPCFRSQDIDEIGDNRHTTFFEMLGDWILGEENYKEEQLTNLFIFLTNEHWLNLDPTRLYFTVFVGDKLANAPKDFESVDVIQKKLFLTVSDSFLKIGDPTVNDDPQNGMKPSDRIFYYGSDKNWWSISGKPSEMAVGDIGGPDCEVFYDFDPEEKNHIHQNATHKDPHCHPNCPCGRFLEIGNSVFIEFEKNAEEFIPLPKPNVDFGGGLERLTAAVLDQPDIFQTDLYLPIIRVIEDITKQSYSEDKNKPEMRIIADHMKAATFLIRDGVIPSNKLQGYILRRLLRRSAVKLYQLTKDMKFLLVMSNIYMVILSIYDGLYGVGHNTEIQERNLEIIRGEINKFGKTLSDGFRRIEKIDQIDGKIAFDLYQTFGFPYEVTEELFRQKGQEIDREQFKKEFEKHKELSRTASAGMFKGGLADQSETVTKYHTATHLLHQALRDVLGADVFQKGSNITAERLRFDFSFDRKMTDEEIKQVEDLVNQKITEDLKVTSAVLDKEEAKKSGALGLFNEKYGEKVTVYTIGNFSKEVCGGPHVEHAGVIGKIQIIKEEAVSSGIRRIRAQIE